MPAFIDRSSPGYIFSGEQEHFDGLWELGGSPIWISEATKFRLMQTPVSKDDPEPWIFRSAPDFWVEESLKYMKVT